MSDIDSSDKEYTNAKRMRHIRHKKNPESSDSESDLSTAETHNRFKPLPSPPKRAHLDYADSPASSSNYTMVATSTPENTRRNVDLYTPSIETTSTPTARESDFQLDFKREVLRKLNFLISKVNSLEQLIASNDGNTNPIDRNITTFEDDTVYPIKNETQFQHFEQKLRNDPAFFKNKVNTFKRIGGVDIQAVTMNILKKIMSNYLANQFSFHGKKKKMVFRETKLFELIVEIVGYHHPKSTEACIGQIVSTWLTQSGLRLSREVEKSK